MSIPAHDAEDLERLSERIRRLEDVHEINNLLVRYARASDRHNDPDLMVPLFTEDGALDVGSGYGRFQGHDVLRAFFLETPKIISFSLHYMISPQIEIGEDGRTATAFWYLWEPATMPDPATGDEMAVWIGGTYDADLVKSEDGRWLFKEIRLDMKFMSPYPEGWVKQPWHDFGRPADEG